MSMYRQDMITTMVRMDADGLQQRRERPASESATTRRTSCAGVAVRLRGQQEE